MKNQVLSTEQMQTLIKLGVDYSNASMCECISSDGKHAFIASESLSFLPKNDGVTWTVFKVFTLQDIFDLLPKEIVIKKVSYQLNWNPLNGSLRYDNVCGNEGSVLYGVCYTEEEGILFAAYHLLVWVAITGHLNK